MNRRIHQDAGPDATDPFHFLGCFLGFLFSYFWGLSLLPDWLSKFISCLVMVQNGDRKLVCVYWAEKNEG